MNKDFINENIENIINFIFPDLNKKQINKIYCDKRMK